MAFYKSIEIKPNTTLFLWKIEEDFNTLFRQVMLKDISLARLETMKSESHQKGFLAVRMLLQHIGLSDFDLFYDDFGKPFLENIPQPTTDNQQQITINQISISHSNDFSALVISDKKVGLDIEIIKEKTLKIAPRFMDVSHLENLSDDEKLKKVTVIWGIKESVFKIKNEEGISFQNHIFEDNFNFDEKKAIVQLRFNNKTERFTSIFDCFENYIYVCTF